VKEFPNSYKDPLYASLDAATEEKLGLPKGLLSAIRTRGEKSNADQVSEANAKTPYQFIPATRSAIIEKYGIDPLLSPENASEAAGLLLKESLQRNKNDPALAVAEYIGGTNRKNWGPVTRAYVKRVTGTPLTPQAAPSATIDLPPSRRQSMFERARSAQAQAQPIPEASIASILSAYQSGQMTPEEKAAFEEDVNAGRLMLPAGQSLAGLPPASQIPVAVIDAFAAGKMTAEEEAALTEDVQKGLATLPPGRTLVKGGAARIPGAGGDVAPAATQPIPTGPAPGVLGQALGAGEAALTIGTGMTGGALGTVAGAVGGLAGAVMSGQFGTPEGAQAIERSAMEGAQALTYAPRGQAGQAIVQGAGELLQNLPPVVGVATQPAMLAPIASAAAPVRAAAGQAAGRVAGAVAQGTERITDRIRAIRGTPAEDAMAQRGSVGAAGTEAAAQRMTTAQNLPVPVDLTLGAMTRDADQLAFEKREMTMAETGAPLRARAELNNLQILQNFERMIDQTGAEAPIGDPVATGRAVTGALVSSAARDKAEYRTLYKQADKAGELEGPVPTDTLVQYLNENISGESTAPTLAVTKRELVRLGGATLNEDGTLSPGSLSLRDFEQVRKTINKFVADDANDRRVAAELRVAHDLATDGAGGEAYRKARAARSDYAEKYENRAIVADLLTNRRGMKDPKVALDRVFNRVILQGSPEELKIMERTLLSGGRDGQQAWSELQGATLQFLRDAATSGLGSDSADNRIVSAAKLNQAVKQLDKNGRLDLVLGKKDGQIVRDINDVVQYVNTTPPGTLVNPSGSALMIMSAIAESGMLGMAGFPVPVLTGMKLAADQMKKRKLQQQIDRALNKQASQAKKQPAKF
jgi:hypothetical protein